MQKNVVVLGSTGSVGCQTLEVIRELGFNLLAVAAHSNVNLLSKQIMEWKPVFAALFLEEHVSKLKDNINCKSTSVTCGLDGLIGLATLESADIIVQAMGGMDGLIPTIKALECGKRVCIANKEILVSAGGLILKALDSNKSSELLPIDSEHNAIFQCLHNEKMDEVRKIVLTSSGGPFVNYSKKQLESATPAMALNHPTWKMGRQVTVNSSTLMNKGLEIIEAQTLFRLECDKIECIIHPQSVVHGMVEFVDGSVHGVLGHRTMKIPIQHVLTYPQRKTSFIPCFDFLQYSTLTFLPHDANRFPCLRIAMEAAKVGGTLPCAMCAANEVLVDRFLNGEISWMDIGDKLDIVLSNHKSSSQDNVQQISDVIHFYREIAGSI